jgi:hypothetical protein
MIKIHVDGARKEQEIPTMTVVADNKKRVTIRLAKAGDRFDVQAAGEGKFVLTRLEPCKSRPAKVRIEKRGAYSVGTLDRPITIESINEALNEFP